ncbi:hypothetical protein BN1708_020645, partial [Verticillium longisporum]
VGHVQEDCYRGRLHPPPAPAACRPVYQPRRELALQAPEQETLS